MTIIISTAALAIIVALAVVCALLVRVLEKLNVISIQLSERRGWERKP
jgi:hypothetical protein